MRRLGLPISRRVAPALSLSVLLLVPLALMPAAAAGACGTEWTSRKEPPQTILVLRTATGVVQEVNFKRYVAVVMASGEWPTTLHRAVLEAGALATKQYGWYYALQGNHRDGDVSLGGRCYDVRDDSRDQVFRPESAEPTEKQKTARDALWGLSLRKRDAFFLTGYRRGSATKCAADAEGFKLYVTSAKDCAKRLDYDSERILEAYYSPGLEFVWAPGTEPAEPEASDGEDDTGSVPLGDDDQEARPLEVDPGSSPGLPDQPDDAGPEPQGLGSAVSQFSELVTDLLDRFDPDEE